MGQLSIFAFCFQVRGLAFLQKAMMNDGSNVLPFPQKGVFRRSRGHGRKKSLYGHAPYTPRPLSQSLRLLHMISASLSITYTCKGITFIAIEKRSKHPWFISFEFTSYPAARNLTPPKNFFKRHPWACHQKDSDFLSV